MTILNSDSWYKLVALSLLIIQNKLGILNLNFDETNELKAFFLIKLFRKMKL